MKPHRFTPFGCLTFLMLSSCNGHDIVTYSEVRQIRPNMPIEKVEQIIGHKGRVINGEKIEGAFVATSGELVYFWQNKDKSSFSVATLNGKVVAMSAFDLN